MSRTPLETPELKALIAAQSKENNTGAEQQQLQTRKFLCPRCDRDIDVRVEHIGVRVECSLCGKKFKANPAKDCVRRGDAPTKTEQAALAIGAVAQAAWPPTVWAAKTTVWVARSTLSIMASLLIGIAELLEEVLNTILAALWRGMLYLVAGGFFLFGLMHLLEPHPGPTEGLLQWVCGLLLIVARQIYDLRRALSRRAVTRKPN